MDTELNLNAKQKRFCEEYIIDLNASQAALRSGYSKKTYKDIGAENLSKPNIQAYVSALKIERSKVVEVTSNDVLRKLKDLAYSDITKTMTLTIDEFEDLPDSVRLCISRFKKQEKKYTVGHEEITDTTIEVWFVDKLKAYDMVCRHIGFYEKDNSQLNPNNGEPISIIFAD